MKNELYYGNIDSIKRNGFNERKILPRIDMESISNFASRQNFFESNYKFFSDASMNV